MSKADSKSSSVKEQQHDIQTAPYPYPYPQQLEEDTIDLYELLIILWKRKWVLIAVTLAAILGSFYIALQKKEITTYNVEAVLFPPKFKIALNSYSEFKANRLNSPDSVFVQFTRNLISHSLHKRFIIENGPLNKTTEIEKSAKQITLEVNDGSATLSTKFNDDDSARNGIKWLNDFIKFVDRETVFMLLDDLRISLAKKIKDIENTIESKRKMARMRREDQISRFKEAADIAKKLGILRRVDATNVIQNSQMNVDIATATTPLYYLGFEALMTEISILNNRKSDDPFIPELRDLQENLTVLQSMNFDENKLSAVFIDQPAHIADTNILIPPKNRIVFFGLVIGLVSGIFMVFFIEYLQNQRKKHSE